MVMSSSYIIINIISTIIIITANICLTGLACTYAVSRDSLNVLM